MALREQLEDEGDWLFRHRSYLPLGALGVVAATLATVDFSPDSLVYDRRWQIACAAVSLLGELVRVKVAAHVPKRTSGRNVKGQVADSLNTTGMYSRCRHPLYLGNYLMTIGCVAVLGIWWLTVMMTLIYWIYYERIMLAEERFLRGKYGEAYDEWASKTSAFLPRFGAYEKPSLPFCWRTLVKREYATVFAFVTTFTIVVHLPPHVPWKGFVIDPVWMGIFGGTGVVYLAIRFVRKKTRMLRVEGR